MVSGGSPKNARDGRLAKQPNGKARPGKSIWAASSPGTRVDAKGHPVRDWESTLMYRVLNPALSLGRAAQGGQSKRNGQRGEVVLLIDVPPPGAPGQGPILRTAPQIETFTTLWTCRPGAGALIGKEPSRLQNAAASLAKRLLKNKVQSLIDETRKEGAANHSRSCQQQTRYFRAQCQPDAVWNFRAKATSSARAWWKRAARQSSAVAASSRACFGRIRRDILALRCIHSSRRLDHFWKHRLNQPAPSRYAPVGSLMEEFCPHPVNPPWILSSTGQRFML